MAISVVQENAFAESFINRNESFTHDVCFPYNAWQTTNWEFNLNHFSYVSYSIWRMVTYAESYLTERLRIVDTEQLPAFSFPRWTRKPGSSRVATAHASEAALLTRKLSRINDVAVQAVHYRGNNDKRWYEHCINVRLFLDVFLTTRYVCWLCSSCT